LDSQEHFAGIDVSLKASSICVVDAAGRIVREAKVASEPEALIAWFRRLGLAVTRIGLEAGPLSQWLHAGLTEAKFEAVLLETRHVKAALSAMVVKTDRTDARVGEAVGQQAMEIEILQGLDLVWAKTDFPSHSPLPEDFR
jgi:transposase